MASVDEPTVLRLGPRQLALDAARLANAASAFAAMTADVLERSGEWALDGATSAAPWLASRTRGARYVHKGRVRDGKTLRLLPTAVGPARSGTLSAEHVRSLSACVARHPTLAVEDEAVLVGQALELDARSYAITTRRWIENADDVSDLPGSRPEPQSELYFSKTIADLFELQGSFSPDDGAILEAAVQAGLDRLLRSARDGDPALAGKSVAALRAMALVEMASQSMRREPSEHSVPDRYRVAVVVHIDGPTATRTAATTTANEAAEPPMSCCDATMFRVVLDADGEVLDVGRETSRWPRAIRRAVTIRDGGCVFPGCDRPPGHCDIHHCQPWHLGGETKLDNGALLCRTHHTFLHKSGWSVKFSGRRPKLHRDDGSPFTIIPWRASPSDEDGRAAPAA